MYRVLTYMATITDIVEAGHLELFELPEFESRLAINPLYYAGEFRRWIEVTTELRDPALRVGPRTMLEHIEQTLSDFRCSHRPSAGDLRRMMPNKHGIWKLHPPGVRLYGWCPAPRTFVVVTGALELETKTNKKLNDEKRDEVRNFIRDNHLSNHVLIGDVLAVFPPDAK